MNAVHPGSCTDIPPESPAAPGIFGGRSLAARLHSLSVAFPEAVEAQPILGSDVDERHAEDALFTANPSSPAANEGQAEYAVFMTNLGHVASPESEMMIASPIEGQFLHTSCACLANLVCGRTK